MASLHEAAREGDAKKFESLLRGGFMRKPADPNESDSEGATALHIAAGLGHAPVVRVILSHGASVNAKTRFGVTALHAAAQSGSAEAATALVQRVADLSVTIDDGPMRGFTPLHVAANECNAEVAEALLGLGADVNAKAESSLTPLLCAAGYAVRNNAQLLQEIYQGKRTSGRVLETMKVLAKHGADVNVRGAIAGETPLHLMGQTGLPGATAVLLDNGADLGAREQSGSTPLHYAAHTGGLGVVKLLVERGADVNVKNKDGLTPLDMAQKREQQASAARIREDLAAVREGRGMARGTRQDREAESALGEIIRLLRSKSNADHESR